MNKKRKKNLEEDLLAGGTDVGIGLGIMKTVAAPIYFGLLQSTDTIIPMPINKKRKANLEEDILAGGIEGCGCPRLDGYKVQKPKYPVPIKTKRKANLEEDLLAGGTDVGLDNMKTVADLQQTTVNARCKFILPIHNIVCPRDIKVVIISKCNKFCIIKCTFITDIKYSLINFTVHDLPFLGVLVVTLFLGRTGTSFEYSRNIPSSKSITNTPYI